MTRSLYEMSVPRYLQATKAVAGILAKGHAFCAERKIDPEVVVETRVFPDMRPFRYQITSVVHFSVGALEAIKTGRFSPPTDKTPYDYAGLEALIATAHEQLTAVTAAEIDVREGTDVLFVVRDVRRTLYTADGFVASFALPNVYFHATTAYVILRSIGVPLEKRDFIGTPQIKLS